MQGEKFGTLHSERQGLMGIALLTLKQGENAREAGVIMESGDHVFGPIFESMDVAQAFLRWHGGDPRLDGEFGAPTTDSKFLDYLSWLDESQAVRSKFDSWYDYVQWHHGRRLS